MIEPIITVNKAYRPLWSDSKRINVIYGGAGSAKSYELAQFHIAKCVSSGYYKNLVTRKHYNTIKDSVYALIKMVIIDKGLESEFIFRVSPFEIIHKRTGNSFIFRGMDDPEKIKSVVDPTDVWMEEASEFDREDYMQLNIRIRGNNDTAKQLWISFNPIDEEHWLKSTFFDEKRDDLFILWTTYKDNKFIDSGYKQALESLINEDENYYNVYALGKWGTVDSRGLIYKNFSDDNIKPCPINKELPLILCCDFNVDPMKWAFVQNDRGIVKVVSELVLPDTDTERMCMTAIERKLTPDYIYGDYSGTFRHTSSRSTDYNIIQQYFPNAKLKTKPNPSVIDRFNAMNMMLCNKDNKRNLLIDPSCKHFINDMRKVKFVEGKREEDKSQEKYDGKNTINALVHISSAVGYYIEYEFGLRSKLKVTHNFGMKYHG